MYYVATPPLLQVQCPCTGGRWTRAVLQSDVFPCEKAPVVLARSPAWKILDREEYAYIRDNPHLLRFGTVRDPWAWYVSVWTHARRRGGRALNALRAWGRGSVEFKDFIFGATHPEKLTEIPAPLGVVWEPDDDGAWRGLLGADIGLCSYSYLYHYAQKTEWRLPQRVPTWAVDVFIDMEQAASGLSRLTGGAIPPSRFPPIHLPSAAERVAALSLYDVAALSWVEVADRPVIELMGYRPLTPARDSVVPVIAPGARRRGPQPRLSREAREHVERARVKRWRAIREAASGS